MGAMLKYGGNVLKGMNGKRLLRREQSIMETDSPYAEKISDTYTVTGTMTRDAWPE